MKAAVYFGGGSFIAIHAGYSSGALKNVQCDRVYGVSAGALWATVMGFLGLGPGLEILANINKTSDIFAGKNLFDDVGNAVGRKWDSIPFMGLRYDPLKALLKKNITGKPSIPVTVYRVNLETGLGQTVTANPDGTFLADEVEGSAPIKTLDDFLDAVLSSCITAPLVDAFLDANQFGWIDGGFREGGPVIQAIQDGATELHLCLTGLYSEECGFTGNANDPLSLITRELEIMANQNVINQVNLAIKTIPNQTWIYECQGQGTSTVFNQTDIQANIQKASKILPIQGNLLSMIE